MCLCMYLPVWNLNRSIDIPKISQSIAKYCKTENTYFTGMGKNYFCKCIYIYIHTIENII